MQKSRAFLWSSLLLFAVLPACEEEPKVWQVYYEVVRESGNTGEYRVHYTHRPNGMLQMGGLMENRWQSDTFRIEEGNRLAMRFERLKNGGDYRMRIYVGGSYVEEAKIPTGIDEEEISYTIGKE